MAEQSRFIPLPELADILSISGSQAYALVRRGDLRAIKIGGRGQWRVERTELESYIARMYEESARLIAEDPFSEDAELDSQPGEPSGESGALNGNLPL